MNSQDTNPHLPPATIPPKALPPLVRSRPPAPTPSDAPTITSPTSNTIAHAEDNPIPTQEREKLEPVEMNSVQDEEKKGEQAETTKGEHTKRKERFPKTIKRVPIPSIPISPHENSVGSDIADEGSDRHVVSEPNLPKSTSTIRSNSLPPLIQGPASLLQTQDSAGPSYPLPSSSTVPSSAVLSYLYGDVEFEPTSSHPLHSLPVYPTPRHKEQAIHNTVFVESATTGKFKKTDAGSIPNQPLAVPSHDAQPIIPVSRTIIFGHSFALLQSVFVLLQGLTAGYGLLEVFVSVGYLQADSGEFEKVLAGVIGTCHRTFLTLGVACLFSLFAKFAKLPLHDNAKLFSSPSDKSVSRSTVVDSPMSLFFQNSKSTVFLGLTYLFVVITLLVDAQHIDRVETARLRPPAVNLHNYFILNAIRGASTVLSWLIVVATNHPLLA